MLIASIVTEVTDAPVDVYNFQVEDYHTYFVGENAVWVHNAQCPVPEPRKSEKNGLTYQSNKKHTRGQQGNVPKAGIEPKNSFELFENSVQSRENPKTRFTYEESSKTVHRFTETGKDSSLYHWNGSTNQGDNSLPVRHIPGNIRKLFTNQYCIK